MSGNFLFPAITSGIGRAVGSSGNALKDFVEFTFRLRQLQDAERRQRLQETAEIAKLTTPTYQYGPLGQLVKMPTALRRGAGGELEYDTLRAPEIIQQAPWKYVKEGDRVFMQNPLNPIERRQIGTIPPTEAERRTLDRLDRQLTATEGLRKEMLRQRGESAKETAEYHRGMLEESKLRTFIARKRLDLAQQWGGLSPTELGRLSFEARGILTGATRAYDTAGKVSVMLSNMRKLAEEHGVEGLGGAALALPSAAIGHAAQITPFQRANGQYTATRLDLTTLTDARIMEYRGGRSAKILEGTAGILPPSLATPKENVLKSIDDTSQRMADMLRPELELIKMYRGLAVVANRPLMIQELDSAKALITQAITTLEKKSQIGGTAEGRSLLQELKGQQ